MGFLNKVFERLKTPSPCVCSFMGSNVNSSSFAVIYANTIWIKIHNWAVTYICWLVQLQWEPLTLCDVPPKPLSQILGRDFTAPCNYASWWLYSFDLRYYFHLFLKSQNNETAASTNGSFIISLPWNDLLCLKMEWLIRNEASVPAFTVEVSPEKNDCCPDSCNFNFFTFLFLSTVRVRKWRSMFPFLEIAMIDWQIKQTRFECDIAKLTTSMQNGRKTFFHTFLIWLLR